MIPVSRSPAPPGPAGPVIAGPSERCSLFCSPPACSARGRGASLFLTPSVAIPTRRTTRSAFTTLPVKDGPLPRTRAPSVGSLPPLVPAIHVTRLREAWSCELPRQPPSGVCIRCAIREHDLEPTEPRFTLRLREEAGAPEVALAARRDRVETPLAGRSSRGSTNQGPGSALASPDAALELGRSRARQAGRPQPASTRAPAVAMRVTRVTGEATRAGPPIRVRLLRACRGRAT
jgi:hypothetical protein